MKGFYVLRFGWNVFHTMDNMLRGISETRASEHARPFLLTGMKHFGAPALFLIYLILCHVRYRVPEVSV